MITLAGKQQSFGGPNAVIVVAGKRFRHALTCPAGVTDGLSGCECGTTQEAWAHRQSATGRR